MPHRFAAVAGAATRAALALVVGPLGVALVTLGCGSGSGAGGSTTGATSAPSSPSAGLRPTPVTPPQTWDLTIQSGGLTETVQVRVGATSFEEDGIGQWFFQVPPQHVSVGGTITGTRWQFVGMRGSGDAASMTGTGSGLANGSFPFATSVSGSVVWTIETLNGPQTVPATWTGVRTE